MWCQNIRSTDKCRAEKIETPWIQVSKDCQVQPYLSYDRPNDIHDGEGAKISHNLIKVTDSWAYYRTSGSGLEP